MMVQFWGMSGTSGSLLKTDHDLDLAIMADDFNDLALAHMHRSLSPLMSKWFRESMGMFNLWTYSTASGAA